MKLIVPFRYANVEDGVYRGAYPTAKNHRFLRRLKLRTVVSLTPKPPSDVEAFCRAQGIIHMHVAVEKFKEDVTLTHEVLVQLLEMLVDASRLPVYVHCLDGANVTGQVIMCLRKLQNWSLAPVFTEFQRFTRQGTILATESELVELFTAKIRLPADRPAWLWGGHSPHRLKAFRLRYPRPPQPPVDHEPVDEGGLPDASHSHDEPKSPQQDSLEPSSAGTLGDPSAPLENDSATERPPLQSQLQSQMQTRSILALNLELPSSRASTPQSHTYY